MIIYLDKITIETNITIQYLGVLINNAIGNESLVTTKNENRISLFASKVIIDSNKYHGVRITNANTFYNIEISIDITKIKRIEL